MKVSDVKVGGIYLTRVSGELVAVRVLGERTPVLYQYEIDAGKKVPRRYRVARADSGQMLQKLRTAAALRPLVTVRTVSGQRIDAYLVP